MKTKTLVSLITLLSLLGSLALAAPLGTTFTYQGRLAIGGGGTPDPADRFGYRFSLFDVPSGGIQLTDTVTHASIPYADGLFTLPLDFGSNTFTGAARWLQIEVRPATNNPATPERLSGRIRPTTISTPQAPINS